MSNCLSFRGQLHPLALCSGVTAASTRVLQELVTAQSAQCCRALGAGTSCWELQHHTRVAPGPELVPMESPGGAAWCATAFPAWGQLLQS